PIAPPQAHRMAVSSQQCRQRRSPTARAQHRDPCLLAYLCLRRLCCQRPLLSSSHRLLYVCTSEISYFPTCGSICVQKHAEAKGSQEIKDRWLPAGEFRWGANYRTLRGTLKSWRMQESRTARVGLGISRDPVPGTRPLIRASLGSLPVDTPGC